MKWGTEVQYDKRDCLRVTFRQGIDCVTKKTQFSKRLSDLSAGGMFIDKLTSELPGTFMMVQFSLKKDDDPIVASARVRYIHDKIGAGVQFMKVKPEDRARIIDLVQKLSHLRGRPAAEEGNRNRVILRLPVSLAGTEANGRVFEENTHIVALTSSGVCIKTARELSVDGAVLIRTSNGSTFGARVSWITRDEIWVQNRGLSHAFGVRFP